MEYGYQLRIIEQMPLTPPFWSRDFILSDTILAALSESIRSSVTLLRARFVAAQLWRVTGGPATVGNHRPVSHAFCSNNADRTRLTADGQVCNRLFGYRGRPICSLRCAAVPMTMP